MLSVRGRTYLHETGGQQPMLDLIACLAFTTTFLYDFN